MATRVKPTIVAVAPTSTQLFEPVTVGAAESVSIQVENLDGSQTFVGVVRSRLDPANNLAPSTLPDFAGIPPGESVVATLSLPASAELDVVGTMSGVGGNVRVTVSTRMNGALLSAGRSR